jgi:predicted metal-dependent hydrolase
VTQPVEFRRPEGVSVTYRRMKFEFEQGFPRYYHSGSAFKSLFWTQLSTAFDPGETFFIDSARALRKHITDPKLAQELMEFCKQEGHHTAQHLKFDKINAANGIDVESCAKRYRWILNRCRRKLQPIEMLATTVALEHFTSCFAEQYFANPSISEGADEKVKALWAWHAAEELEHRATCYDIYKAAGGAYWMRCVHLVAAWAIILGISMVNTASLLKKDGKLFTRDTLAGLGYLFGRKGVVTGLTPAFFRFFSPRFHPWKGESGEQIAQWASENRRYMAGVPADAA